MLANIYELAIIVLKILQQNQWPSGYLYPLASHDRQNITLGLKGGKEDLSGSQAEDLPGCLAEDQSDGLTAGLQDCETVRQQDC